MGRTKAINPHTNHSVAVTQKLYEVLHAMSLAESESTLRYVSIGELLARCVLIGIKTEFPQHLPLIEKKSNGKPITES